MCLYVSILNNMRKFYHQSTYLNTHAHMSTCSKEIYIQEWNCALMCTDFTSSRPPCNICKADLPSYCLCIGDFSTYLRHQMSLMHHSYLSVRFHQTQWVSILLHRRLISIGRCIRDKVWSDRCPKSQDLKTCQGPHVVIGQHMSALSF